MIIQQIRNATLKNTYGDITFLVDPWLQDKGTGFSARTIRSEMVGVKCPLNDLPDTPESILSGVDCCFVTHYHPDHFTPDYLPKNMMLIAQNKTDQDILKKLGFENTRYFNANILTIGKMNIHKTIAVHGENEAVIKKCGEACGYIFESSNEKKLYIAGDTVYCETVEDIIKQHRPDVIILNCCGATMPIGRLIMDLNDVEKICKAAPDALVIASHLDSVNHATVTSDEVRQFVLNKKLKQVLVPQNGEIIVV